MISIIDYEGGNISSVVNMLKILKINFNISKNYKEINLCKKIILPGVAHFDYCMSSLKKIHLIKL